MARNVLKCNLSGSERITNNSYLKKQLTRLGVTEEYFRYHYAAQKCVSALREDIAEGRLAQCAVQLGDPEKEPSNAEWLLRVATMNGKNKLFTSLLEERNLIVTASSTTKTVTVPAGEPETSDESSGSLV